MRTAVQIILVLGALIVANPATTVQAEEDSLSDQLDRLLADAQAEGASGVLRVALKGEVVYESGYGSASCDHDVPVQADYVFMIGSITKEFTRLLGYILEERGALSRDDTLGDWLPGLDGPIGQLSLQQLMDHVAGLPDLIDEDGQPVPYTIEYDYEPVSRNQLIARARLASLIHEPGTTEEYSNLGYQLLAAIYELATKRSYPDLLRQYIYEPAGMAGTDFWFDDKSQGQLVDGCYPGDERWGNPVEDRMWDQSGPSWNLMGAGGLLSTAESLGRFLDGIGEEVYFETREQAERYKSNRMVFSEKRQQLVMGPSGSNGIFDAVAFWADGDRLSVVLMTNRADHRGEDRLIRDVLGLVR